MSQLIPLLDAVQTAWRAGREQEARDLLQQAIREHPDDYRAWLWLAGVAPTPQASLGYIERAERLKPGDPAIAQARAWAEAKLAATAVKPVAPTPAEPVLSTTKKSTPPPPTERQRQAPAVTTEDAIERLRAVQSQAAPEQRRTSRKPWFALAMLAVLVICATATWIWRAPIQAFVSPYFAALLAQNQRPVEQVAAVSSNAGSVGNIVETQLFLRGQFEPRLAAIPGDAPVQTPTPTPTIFPLQPKLISAKQSSNEPRPRWTVTPSPTNTPTPSPTPMPTFVSENPTPVAVVMRPEGVGETERWVDVNLTTQTLVAYEGNTPVFNTLISSGTAEHPTVTGQFRVWLRFEAQTMDGRRLGYDYYLPNVPYVMYFYQDYALHGTFWHNNFGRPMSHGCVNLPTPAAEWIFNWSELGTLVNVHY